MRPWVYLLVVPAFLVLMPAAAGAAGVNDGCFTCHGQQGITTRVKGEIVSLYVNQEVYQQSVHRNQACTSCHGEIRDIPHREPLYGPELVRRVGQSCAACHGGVAAEYERSVHASALNRGGNGAGCSSCHGSHDIRPGSDPASMVYTKNVPSTCTRCHQGEIAESYRESFHGAAVSLGSRQSPTCATCHGSHLILPPEDPNSTVSAGKLPQTCASCHRVPQKNFAVGPNHLVKEGRGAGAPVYWTEKFFTWLTILTMVALVVHIEVELVGEWRRAGRREGQTSETGEKKGWKDDGR